VAGARLFHPGTLAAIIVFIHADRRGIAQPFSVQYPYNLWHFYSHFHAIHDVQNAAFLMQFVLGIFFGFRKKLFTVCAHNRVMRRCYQAPGAPGVIQVQQHERGCQVPHTDSLISVCVGECGP
jgi:hypothetical protein